MKRIFCVLLLALGGISAVRAEVVPNGGHRDARVKTVSYDSSDVVKVVGRYGYSTVIEFGEGEVVTDVALGDTLAWEVAPARNNLFVKPREDKAATNMTVVTDKRIYHFMLQAQPHASASPKDAFFAVRFRYPSEEAAKRAAELEAQRTKAALAIAPKPVNWDYWACGDLQLRPTEVYDDGRFTYLRFPGAQEIPAVFVVNADNSESLSNGQMRGDQFVVYATAKKLVLRRGKAVGCVENRAFNWYGVYTTNGTTSEHVQRTVDGVPPPPPARILPVVPAEEDESGDDQAPAPMPTPFVPVPTPPQGAAPAPAGMGSVPSGVEGSPVGTAPEALRDVLAPEALAKGITLLSPATLRRGITEVLHAKHGKG